jgi:pimeloyl-ACP methyl ester carboxylesterase
MVEGIFMSSNVPGGTVAGVTEHHTVASGSVDLHVVTSGRSDAPALVLLHGWPEDWRCWEPVIEHLADRFRLVIPDQRGFGRSDAPEGTAAYHLSVLMGDLISILDHFGLARPGLVGHDLGGALAWSAAAFVPDRVGRAVILASPHPLRFREAGIDDPRQLSRAFYVWLMHAGPSGEALLAAGDFERLASWAFAGSKVSEQRIEEYRRDWARPGRFHAMAEWYRANYRPELFNPDVPLSLPAIEVAVRYLHGELDLAFVPGAATGSGDHVDGDFDEQIVPGATHWLTHDVPDVVAHAISDWMDGGD